METSQPNPLSVDLANRLKEIRRLRGHTQKYVAENLQVNYRHLQKIEGGKADFKLSTLSRLAALFEIEPCFLANIQASALFQSVSLPCQSLMFDALPVGLVFIDEDGTSRLRNRRARELFQKFSDTSAAEINLIQEFVAKSDTLSESNQSVRWKSELDGCTLFLEARLQKSPQGKRQAVILFDVPSEPFIPQPIPLSREPTDGTLAVSAENIRRYRQIKRLTQAGAAKLANMSLRYYQKVESGRLDLKCSTLEKLARTFEVSPCQLLVEKGLRPPCGGNYFCTAGVLDLLPFGVLAADTNGEIAYGNKAYFQLIDRQPDPTTQRYYWDILDTEKDKETGRSKLQQIFGKRPAPQPYEREYTNKEGLRRQVVSHWHYLLSGDGDLLGIVGLARSVD
jgi:transcriptional regulator with XRE-family HTH domain